MPVRPRRCRRARPSPVLSCGHGVDPASPLDVRAAARGPPGGRTAPRGRARGARTRPVRRPRRRDRRGGHRDQGGDRPRRTAEARRRRRRAVHRPGPGLRGVLLGGALAQNLALADGKARGLLLMHGTSDIADDASTEIPVQLHVADHDTYEPVDWLNAWYLRMSRAGADVEIFRYRGAGHLFTDPGLPDHDAEAADRAWTIARSFITDL
ncbi:dienelactone hydrolase family protein [Actinomadura yumaensis]|uniref:dienelactone hydrolase family protein n=1 Tax=Actinomadura yumaensis TaxID=111807 RepID=UPI00360EF29B